MVEVTFSTPIPTSPGAHMAPCNVGNRSFFPGVEQLVCGSDQPSRNEIIERVELYLYSPSWLLWSVIVCILPYSYMGRVMLKVIP